MRCVAGAGLLLLVGCNQVFGIHKTELFDAAPDVIADLPYVKLTAQIADVLPLGNPGAGGPDPVILDAPIDPAPTVRYGALGQPLQDTTYSPADGTVIVAREFFEPQPDGKLPTWRLEYTLAGDVPHEVQWSPESKHGQLTVPLFGRATRKAVPIGGGYTVTPDGTLANGDPLSFQSPHIFTTGQWSEGLIPAYTAGPTIDYDFHTNASPMSGGLARPEPLLGDRAFLIDYSVDATGCRFANGSAELASAALEPDKRSVPAATWDSRKAPVTSEPVSFVIQSRFLSALGPLHSDPKNPGALSGTASLGIAASGAMPPLTGVPPSKVPTPTLLPTPVMITVLQCPFDFKTLPDTAQPAGLAAFPRMMNVQLVSTRAVGNNVALSSGMETAISSPTSMDFKLTFPAAIPTKLSLATPTNPAIALDGADEQVDLGAAGGALTLTFAPDSPAASADYYDVTLYKIDAGALAAVRIYTVTTPEVAIDGALLAAGATYVFQIRSFKGHPGAPANDFRGVAFPYGSAIVFTRTFHTS